MPLNKGSNVFKKRTVRGTLKLITEIKWAEGLGIITIIIIIMMMMMMMIMMIIIRNRKIGIEMRSQMRAKPDINKSLWVYISCLFVSTLGVFKSLLLGVLDKIVRDFR